MTAYTIKSGTTQKLLFVRASKSALRHDTPGARAAYVRAGEGARSFELSRGELGVWSKGGFVEVDAQLMPGVYQLGAPDEVFAAGATRALLILQFPEADLEPIDVELVAYDPQDSVRLGLSALGPEARLQALRGAFPRLAAKEIAEREALKER